MLLLLLVVLEFFYIWLNPSTSKTVGHITFLCLQTFAEFSKGVSGVIWVFEQKIGVFGATTGA